MALESTIFWQKSSHEISDTDTLNLIINRFTQFKLPFSLQNKKEPILPHYSALSLYFKFHLMLCLLRLSFRRLPSSFSHLDLHLYLLQDEIAFIIANDIRMCSNRTKSINMPNYL